MKKKDLVADYKYFQVKRKSSDDGKEYLYVDVKNKVEFILIFNDEIYWRKESTPAHCEDRTDFNYYPFSATIDIGEMPFQALERKSEEEAGLVITKSNILYQGYFFESKHISSVAHLFIVEVLEAKHVEPRTDRTFWKTFGKTLAAKKDVFLKEMANKQIETTVSLEFLATLLKTLK